MLQSYLKLALRSLLRYKMHSVISVLGLGVGFACFIITFVFIAHEMRYDAFHTNAQRIYRMSMDSIAKDLGTRNSYATSPHSITPLLKRDFPEIEDVVRIFSGNTIRYGEYPSVHYGDKHFLEKQIYYADPNFFQMFSFPLIEGDAQTALAAPYSIVLTQKMALKYFGNDSPIGKTLQIRIGSKEEYLVTGVVKDRPSNTHFKFDFITSLKTFRLRRGFNDGGYYTYILLSENTSPELLVQKFPEFLDRHKYSGKKWERRLVLQPLQDIHLYSHFKNELSPNRDVRYLYFLIGIALCTLLIVCVNYVNFSTFRFANRAKEVGLRKVFGSVRSQLIQQFLGETLLITLLSFVLSLALVECSLPYVSGFLGQELAFDHTLVTDYGLILLGAVVTIGLVAGLYPAFFLSRFDPIDTLGGNAKVGSTTVLMRKVLIVFQFALSIVLLTTTLSLHTQLQFLKNHDLGFDREHVITFSADVRQPSRIAEYLEDPRILSISESLGAPGVSQTLQRDRFIPEGSSTALTINTMDVGYIYLETIGLKLIAGRNFSEDMASDQTDAFIINEAAAKMLEWENPIGKKLERTSRPQLRSASSKVVGVVKDFHYQSLHTAIEPLVIGVRFDMQGVLYITHLTARIHPGDIPGALAFLKAKTQELVPDEPLQYYFLDDVFEQFYREEEKIFRLIGFFSTLSIVIICLGVLGLASFMVDQRVKEIGIRKVLGASSSSIVYLLMKDVLIWVGIANAIAWPVVYLTNQAWLQHFAYRIDFDVWAFFFGSLAQIVTVFFTIGLQTSRAVQMNPVHALRSE